MRFRLSVTATSATASALGAAVLIAGFPAAAASSTRPTPAPPLRAVPVASAPSAPPAPAAHLDIGDPGGPLPPDAGAEVVPLHPPTKPRVRRAAPAAPLGSADAEATIAAAPVPPTPYGLPSSIESLSPYLGQVSCDSREKPGVRAFADLLLKTYPATSSAGIVRPCLRGGTSEHKEGRAFDWWVSASDPAGVADVNALVNWLFRTDAAGNRYAMARRLGLMYLIWDAKSWSTYRSDEGWRPYSCSGTTGCHRDHVHFSFSWAGASRLSSYWTKSVSAVDYGPCVPSGQRNAPPHNQFNGSRCPSVSTPLTPTTDLQFLQQNLYLAAAPGDRGSAVAVIQRQVGATADGVYGSGTAAAVSSYQRAYRLPVTGRVGTLTWRAFLAGALRAVQRRVGDYSGDGRADLAVFRPSTGAWYVRGVTTSRWGVRGDVPVPGDYNGDGRIDRAVFRPSTGVWWVRGIASIRWGVRGDVPVPADYNGDGRAELAVFRPSTGVWWVRGRASARWGVSGDVPVPANYSGDGRAELAVFRPSTGVWWVRGVADTRWGKWGDLPAPADFNGDGRAELAVFRPSTGNWWIPGVAVIDWGGARGDVPSPADYNADRRSDVAVFRPSTGTWWVSGVANTQWGVPGDVPLVLPYAIARDVIRFW